MMTTYISDPSIIKVEHKNVLIQVNIHQSMLVLHYHDVRTCYIVANYPAIYIYNK